MILDPDTIVALATPAGRSALSVVRLSGPDAHQIAARFIASLPRPRQATRYVLRDPDTEQPFDDAIVTLFASPNSYTGEPVVEFSCHGGHVAPAALMTACLREGARLARPGEFTQRAFLNGKLDLVQAEAIADLIDAHTEAMRHVALSQLDGGLSRAIAELRTQLIDLEALVTYDIDFPEEDDGSIDRGRVREAAAAVLESIARFLRTTEIGRIARDGATVVLAGIPNAGKSSLFNALLGARRALVTDIPGTTRDALDAMLETSTIPLRLVDTAGLHESSDEIERMGIETAKDELRRAHVVLFCGATSEEIDLAALRAADARGGIQVRVLTKLDLSREVEPRADVSVSATTRAGLRDLIDLITARVETRFGTPSAAALPILTRARHVAALQQARDEVEAFLQLWGDGQLPATLAVTHLRTASHELGELTGSIEVDDILAAVFSRFCVGK